MSAPSDDSIRNAAALFVAAFEKVFHTDWAYTKSQLGIDDRGNDEARAQLLRIFGEDPVPPDDPDATFLDPRRDLEADNWGNYELLLKAYADLKRVLPPAESARNQ